MTAALSIVEGWGGGAVGLSPAAWAGIGYAAVVVVAILAAHWAEPWE